MAQAWQQSTRKSLPKPHVHVMVTQMSVEDGMRKIWRQMQQGTTKGAQPAT